MPITADIGIKTQAELRGTQISAISSTGPIVAKKKRVAIYCRISSLDNQITSIEAQRDHFLHMAKADPEVTLVDVYYEEGISGTETANRPELQRLLNDCRAGLIDEIWCKSISRWARNLEQLLATIMELRELGVEIYFEKESVRTLSGSGDIMLNIYGSFSEFESKSIKLNTKMGYRNRMQRGEFFYNRPPFGYDAGEDGGLVVNAQEAATVRRIFDMCLDGVGSVRISNLLNAEGVPTKRGAAWQPGTIRAILANITYTGDVLLQKTIRIGNAPRIKNDGREDQYYVTDHHEAIVSHEIFDAAQAALTSRARGRTKGDGKSGNRYAFSGKLTCGHCGHNLHRAGNAAEIQWICTDHKGRGCPLKPVPDLEVKAAFKSIVTDIDQLLETHGSFTADDSPTQKLQANLSQQEAVRTLQPVLGVAEYTRRLNALQQEEETLRQQASGSAIDALRKACGRIPARAKWADYEPVFKEHVESVTIWQGGKMEFKFKCGVRIVSERDY